MVETSRDKFPGLLIAEDGYVVFYPSVCVEGRDVLRNFLKMKGGPRFSKVMYKHLLRMAMT